MIDTSLLKLLLSTNILLNSVLLNHDAIDVKTTVTEILKSVNQAQQFITYNCDVRSSYYNNRYFFGYSMTKTKTNKYRIDIDDVLKVLTSFGLVTRHERCSVPQMLLWDVLDSNDIVSTGLQNITLIVERRVVTVDTIFHAIKKINNIDIIYWYMQIILDAILRLICYGTDELLSEKRVFNTKITEGFKLLSFLFTEFTIDSEELIDGFNFLASNQEITDTERDRLKKVMRKYFSRNIVSPEIYFDNTDSSKMLPFFNISGIKVEKNSLEKFMNAIINRISDYKCFVNMFELLKIDYNQYYMIHKRNPYEVFNFVQTIIFKNKINRLYDKIVFKNEETRFKYHSSIKTETENMCKLVIKLYQYCVEYSIFLADDIRDVRNITNNNLAEEVSNIFYCILNTLENIYNNYHTIRDRYLNELLMEIIPVLETKRDEASDWKNQSKFIHIRILFVIMTALDKYGLEACNNDKYDYLIFNNIDYDTTGEHPIKNQEIIDNLKTLINLAPQPTGSITLPDLNYSFKKTQKNILKFKLLTGDKKIRFYWRGELKTIDEIYKNVEIYILNPFYVHALYDVYFKFLMTTLYYEFRITIEYVQRNYALRPSERANNATYITSGNIKYPDFGVNIHPRKLAKAYNFYLKRIQTIIYQEYNIPCFYIPKSIDFIEVENKIRECGIVIDLVLPKRELNYSCIVKDNISDDEWLKIQENNKKTIKIYNNIFVDINKALNDATNEFLKFRTFYNTYINWEVPTTPTTTK